MDDINHQYSLTRQCKNCSNEDKFFFSKREYAFELYDTQSIHHAECTKCQSTQSASVVFDVMMLDKEILLEWAFNQKYVLIYQDEQLFLAEEYYLDMIVDVLDNYEILAYKRNVLFEALCIIIYDNHDGSTDESRLLIQKVSEILLDRKEGLLLAKDYIYDYIKDIVFPILKIKE
jgi:hypothetical protein